MMNTTLMYVDPKERFGGKGTSSVAKYREKSVENVCQEHRIELP